MTEINAPETPALNTPAKRSRLPLFIGGGCGILLLCVFACVGAYFFFVVGIGGEPANATTVEKVSQEFVSALHDGQFDSAHNMFLEKLRAQISVGDLKSLAEEEPIANYRGLSVCEFQVFFGDNGKQLVGLGLLRYRGGIMAFESSLLQGDDKNWYVYGFHLKPDVDTKPWGACQYDPP